MGGPPGPGHGLSWFQTWNQKVDRRRAQIPKHEQRILPGGGGEPPVRSHDDRPGEVRVLFLQHATGRSGTESHSVNRT